MTGILTKVSDGVILAENFESYPNSWTASGTGNAGICNKGHSGAKSFRQLTGFGVADPWNNAPNGWTNGSAHSFSKTVDVKSGIDRVARVFRGPGEKASVIDDFNDTTLDWTLWRQAENPTYTVTGSVVRLTYGSISGYEKMRIRIGVKMVARLKVEQTNKDAHWKAINADENNQIDLYFKADGHLYVEFGKYGDFSDTVDAGTYDAGYHVYEVYWQTSGGAASVKRDGSTIATSTKSPVDEDGYRYYTKFGDLQSGAYMDIDYVGWLNQTGAQKASLKIGSQTLFDNDVQTETFSMDGEWYDSGWIPVDVSVTGSQSVELKHRNASGATAKLFASHLWDDLIIMLDSQVKITSLLGGQKVELLDAGGVVRKTVTCPEYGTDVYMTISDLLKTAYGFSGYFKVYDTDGISLLYTSTTEARWGGDVYKWIPNQSKCDIATNYTLIYRSGSGLSPTEAVVTVTLTDKDTGDKLSGKTIDWAGVLGTVNPASNNTDGNGQASTTFSAGTSAGLGGVRASFAGDATYGPSSALQQIDIYYGQVTVDSTKDFQVWIEGQEMVYSEGDYKLSADFKPQPFRVVGPSFTTSTGFWWAIEIYRKGTKEFQGRILTRKRQTGTNPMLTISGVGNLIMLQRRVANRTYQDDPKLIIEDLLSRYPCGITVGTISQYGSVVKLEATYENLYDALAQIKRITGWLFRLNANNTLDFAPSFGSTKDITVKTGLNETAATHEEDAAQLDSGVFVVGDAPSAALISHVEDATAQLNYGVIEEAFLEKGISEQGTLDLRAQEILNERKNIRESTSVDWADTLAPGFYAPFDSLTVEDSDAGLSGTYQVSSIIRRLVDANMATLQLVNRIVTLADAMQAIRKDVKDLGVA